MSRNVLMSLMAASGMMFAQELMPVPASITTGEGRLTIDAHFSVALEGYKEPRLEALRARIVSRLAHQTGIPMTGPAEGAAPTLVIETKAAGEKVQTLHENESYTLEVTAKQARISAATPVGAIRGVETFLQLVMPSNNGFSAPAVRIDDKPRFAWRGLMIDSSRHFLPVDVMERNLDGMAAVKLNVMHWHFSDNQGFRIESKKLPKLQEIGSNGQYYTQAEVRHLIEYARERGIRIVPEIDMPGHSSSILAAYPEIASSQAPKGSDKGFGVLDPTMDPTNEKTYKLVDKLIGEMAELFPDEYFHIGGDEVNGKSWDSNPAIQSFMKSKGFKTNAELQTYFNSRLLPIVTKHHKKMMGWDEILQPNLPKDIMVQAWRDTKSLANAASQGYQTILSTRWYLDLMHSAEFHYQQEPFADEAASLTDEQRSHILGGEACEWTELASAEGFDSRIWPRMAVIAERFWSPRETTDVRSMYRRMKVESSRLEFLGLRHEINSRLILDRMAGYQQLPALYALAAAVEPAKDYERHEAGHYTQTTPLNRLVDAAAADSVKARDFGFAVDALLAGDAGKREEVRRAALLWRDQHDQLKDVFASSFLLAEAEPLSADVSALGAAALEAVDLLAAGKTAQATWVNEQKQLIERSKKMRAELVIAIAEPVEKLVNAAAK